MIFYSVPCDGMDDDEEDVCFCVAGEEGVFRPRGQWGASGPIMGVKKAKLCG